MTPWIRLAAGTMCALLAMWSCSPPPLSRGTTAGSALLASSVLDGLSLDRKLEVAGRHVLHGYVQWPVLDRTVQADPATTVANAVVALIDRNTGVTVASGLADATGKFSLPLGSHAPTNGAFYTLEASKGLAGQVPGAQALRLRTIVKWDGAGNGFVSITNAAVGGTIRIDQLTTALAINVALGSVSQTAVIDKVDPVTNSLKPPIGTLDPLAVLDLAADIKRYVTSDMDPIAETSALAPEIDSVTPNTGSAGTLVRIDGRGFVNLPGSTTVKFGTTTATVIMVRPTQIYAIQPTLSAGSQPIKVTVRNLSSGTVPYTAQAEGIAITGFSRNPADRNSPLTLFGTGFVTPLTKNLVYFRKQNTVNGTTSPGASDYLDGDSNSLTIKVPADAVGGMVYVKNADTNAQSKQVFLDINTGYDPKIESVFPTVGASWEDVEVFGDHFGDTAGSVTVSQAGSYYAAQIKYWTDNRIRFLAPNGLVAGAATIEVQNALGGRQQIPWTALNGVLRITSFNSLPIGLSRNVGYIQANLGMSGRKLYIMGGGRAGNDSDATIDVLELGADGAPGRLITNFSSMPFQINSEDIRGSCLTWAGNRMYGFRERSTGQAAYIEFDSVGNFWRTVTDNNVPGSFREAATAVGPNGIYVAGGYDGAAAFWKSYNALNNTWRNNWGSVSLWGSRSDAGMMVLGDRIWYLASDHTASANLDGEGNITGNFTHRGGSTIGSYPVNQVAIGKWIYSIGTWCDWSWYRAEIINGNTPNPISGWPNLGKCNLQFNAVSTIAVGKYFYAVGGYCGSNNNIYYSVID